MIRTIPSWLMICFLSFSVAAFGQQPVVSVMPGYPNAPKLLPEERRPVRPNVPTFIWGNANGGNGTANGASYSWSFLPNLNLAVIPVDGSLTGTIADDRFVAEECVFQLLNGSTRETATATLTVTLPGGAVGARSVQINVVDINDSSSDTDLKRLAIDTNIAIEEGLRQLYQIQNANGSWTTSTVAGNQPCAGTAFVLWAVQNQGHLPTNDPAEDIFAAPVQRGLDFIFRSLVVRSGAANLAAPRANVARGATADGESDLNDNNQHIELCPGGDSGYATPIACSAIIASAAPDRIVGVSPSGSVGALGLSYRTVVEDVIDWMGRTQNNGSGAWGGRGGWNYNPTSAQSRSDMSINSWMYVAMEGAQDVLGINVPDWIKQECEHALVAHQSNASGAQGFGYTGTGSCSGTASHSMATTAGGLSGLVLTLSEGPFVQPGAVISGTAAPLNTLDAKRSAGLAYLGNNWHVVSNGAYCNGHFNNYYGMWTVARALRLTAKALGLPSGQNLPISNGGVLFDWETGEVNGNGIVPGISNPPGTTPVTREGYASWLVRNQVRTGASTIRGRWSTGINFLGPVIETACSILILTPRVFSSPCPAVINIPIVEISPPSLAAFPPGTQVVLSGRAVAASPERPILQVLVNDAPVESLDATGRFFKTVTVGGGTNTFIVRAIDTCGSTDASHTLFGGDPQVHPSASLSTVTSLIAIQYANTTFNTLTNQLIVTARARNISSEILDGPVLMAIDTITQPTITAANPDGYLPDGRAYYVFLDLGTGSRLLPAEVSPPKTLIFNNPNNLPVVFTRSWIAQTNRPPYFVSAPGVLAVSGTTFVYQPIAVDPDQDALSWTLQLGPSSAQIDPNTGMLTWANPAPVGSTHSIAIECRDGRGGVATQSFTLQVSAPIPNRPPLITSVPITQSAIGAPYVYQMTASDPDSDPVTFGLMTGPLGLTVSIDGRVEWPFVLAGIHPIVVRADDGHGGFADQSWSLSAGSQAQSQNTPTIVSIPPVQAVANVPFIYQPVATGIPTTVTPVWSLLTSPVGMQIDAPTGRLTWTPGLAQVGSHNLHVQVSDGMGGSGSQAWVILVLATQPDRPPSITSTPPSPATINQAYSYAVVASDPDLDPITFALVNVPQGMTIGSTSGVLSWTPPQLGLFIVTIIASSSGGSATQTFAISVENPNTSPTITSTPTTSVTVGQAYQYDVNATDPESDPLIYSLDVAPSGMTINDVIGIVSWTPTLAQAGSHPVVVRATDSRGGFITQAYSILVSPDTTAPQLLIVSSASPAPIQTPIRLCVQVADNIGVVARTLSIDGVPQTLDAQGCVDTAFSATGLVLLAATATDGAGNVGTTTRTLSVVDPSQGPNPQQTPVIQVIGPAFGEVLKRPTPLVASIGAASVASMSWQITLTNVRTGSTRLIATGTGTSAGGTLTTIDPTLLPNDTYRGEILAQNGSEISTFPFEFSIAGEYKLGNFVYERSDLSVPVSGIPITISRRYDSLDTSPGDFGAGWSLGLNVRVSDPAREGTNDSLRVGSRVYVTRTDGRRVGFRVQATPLSWLFPFVVQASLTADAGVNDTLTFDPPQTVFVIPGGELRLGLFSDPFNPDRYRFTTREGVAFTIDEVAGLQTVQDIQGNTLSVSPTGITTANGSGVTFVRDGAGRIVEVFEPSTPGSTTPPPSIRYFYDQIGNLVRVDDQTGRSTHYSYENSFYPHHLTRVVDGAGRPVIRSVYSAEGRLLAQCVGDVDLSTLPPDPCAQNATVVPGCVRYCLDPGSLVQTIFDGNGQRIDLILDAEGNILTEKRYLSDGTTSETHWTYVPGTDRIASTTDAAGNVTTYAYDAAGRVLSETDTQGTTTLTYNACGKLLTETDAAGNTWINDYDASCRLIRQHDPLGATMAVSYEGVCSPTGCHISSYTDAVGNTWGMSFDANGHPATTMDPRGFVSLYSYDANGRILSQTDRSGVRVDFLYDGAGRLIKEVFNVIPPVVVEYAYDSGGRLLSVRDPESTVAFSYWSNGTLRSMVTRSSQHGHVFDVTYGRLVNGVLVPGYDGNGNVVSVIDSAGGHTEYRYDELDRLVSAIQSPLPGARFRTKQIDATYDPNGNLLQTTRFTDGLSPPVFTTSYAYGCVGCGLKLNQVENRRGSDNAILRYYQANRDVLGRITSLSDDSGSHTFSYDGVGRIIAATHSHPALPPQESYVYDGVGNRLGWHQSSSTSYGYQTSIGGNQLLQDDTFDYDYDLDGHLIQRRHRTTGELTLFTYDVRGRTIRIRTLDQAGALLKETKLGYDALGRLLSIDDAAGIRLFGYDAENPIVVLDPSGRVLERRFYGFDIDDLIATEEPGQSPRWAITNDVGTITDWVNDSGFIVASSSSDSFGKVYSATQPAWTAAAGFGSRPSIHDQDLWHFRGRIYAASLGRFLAEDLYEPYQYEWPENNPLFLMDPSGLGPLIEYRPLLPTGLNLVYIGCDVAGTLVYIGITQQALSSRQSGHRSAGKSFKICQIVDKALSRKEARALEQCLMNRHGFGNPGGTNLLNKARSVGRNNPWRNLVRKVCGRFTGLLDCALLGC